MIINIVLAITIFLAKVIEISLSSLKTIFLMKGQRLLSSAIAFTECLVWAIVISGIISNLKEEPMWILAYCLGYSCGYFLGSLIESKLALGTCLVQFIIPKTEEQKAVEKLTALGCGVTHIEARGTKEEVSLIISVIPRKRVDYVRKEVEQDIKHSVSFVSDVNRTFGGFGISK